MTAGSAAPGPFVGVTAIVVRDGQVLVGRRLGAHGAGTWAFPGGKVEPGEDPGDAAARELLEETGLVATSIEPVRWTSNVFEDVGHYVTLHHLIVASGEPAVLEPDKIEVWRWAPWDALPEPLFPTLVSLIATGWTHTERQGRS